MVYKRLRENKNEKSKVTWKIIFHLLCSTYGWTIDYVASLKSRQIRLMLEGRIEHDKSMNPDIDALQKDQQFKDNAFNKFKKKIFPKSQHKPSVSASRPDDNHGAIINDMDGMIASGAFNVLDKRRRKK